MFVCIMCMVCEGAYIVCDMCVFGVYGVCDMYVACVCGMCAGVCSMRHMCDVCYVCIVCGVCGLYVSCVWHACVHIVVHTCPRVCTCL